MKEATNIWLGRGLVVITAIIMGVVCYFLFPVSEALSRWQWGVWLVIWGLVGVGSIIWWRPWVLDISLALLAMLSFVAFIALLILCLTGSFALYWLMGLLLALAVLGAIFFWRRRAGILAAIGLAFTFYMLPVYWMVVTSFKDTAAADDWPPTFIPLVQFMPTISSYANTIYEFKWSGIGEDFGGVHLSDYLPTVMHSTIISGAATILAVCLGTLAAYAFSRFVIPAEDDILFFILSTRMLPPVVVIIPIALMFTRLRLPDTYHGMILLYTTFNLPFVVWMMKGFLDEIPKEYEEAAMVDGYTRLQAFWKYVLPLAIPGIAATAVFCIIAIWNEFVFGVILTSTKVLTAPPYIAKLIGVGKTDWGRMAAGSVMYLIPVLVFTFLVRNHLLRGVTFGAVRR